MTYCGDVQGSDPNLSLMQVYKWLGCTLRVPEARLVDYNFFEMCFTT